MLPYPLDLVKAAGLRVFDGKSGRDLNLVAVRCPPSEATPNGPDDILYACWREVAGAGWSVQRFLCRTRPGTRFLLDPMNPKGCAVIVPGQYRRSHIRGLHHGRPALVQAAPVAVQRDNDRDAILEPGPTDVGMFGVNVHDVASFGDLAGCIGVDRLAMTRILRLYDMTAALYGPGITLTLVQA